MRRLLLNLLAIILGTAPILAQSNPDTSAVVYHHEPWPLAPGQSVLTTGFVLALLPAPIVEDEIPTPAAQLQYKRGLFPRTTLVATLSTNFVTNLVQVGLQWNDRTGDWSYAVGAYGVGFLGWLSLMGNYEDNLAYAYGAVPCVRLGYRARAFSVSAMFAFSAIVDAETYVNSRWTKADFCTINDIYTTLAIEQPFLDNGRISIGFILTLSRSPYQSWIMFNTFDQWLLIPEFFVGFQL